MHRRRGAGSRSRDRNTTCSCREFPAGGDSWMFRAREQREVAGNCRGRSILPQRTMALWYPWPMDPTPSVVRIATRESRLAMTQTEMVSAALRERHPGLRVEVVGMTTKGDRVLDRPLAQVGGKGLFVKELEVALAENRADIAVHSMKDVPMEVA